MRERGYDVAPFARRPPDRYVERRWLEGRSGATDDVGQALDASLVVTSALSLTDAMRELQTREFFFVLDGQRIMAVVTRADMHRPAVSMIVLEFVLIIEAGLARLIEAHLGSTWREKLTPLRLQEAEARLLERKRRNTDLTLEDCLTFEDRIALAKESADLLRELGYASKSQFKESTELLKRLRDTLAHAGSVLDFEPDPLAALQFVEQVRKLAERILTLVEQAEGSG